MECSACWLNVFLLLLRLTWLLLNSACCYSLAQSALKLHRTTVDAICHAESDAVGSDVARAKDRLRCVLFIIKVVLTLVLVRLNDRHIREAHSWCVLLLFLGYTVNHERLAHFWLLLRLRLLLLNPGIGAEPAKNSKLSVTTHPELCLLLSKLLLLLGLFLNWGCSETHRNSALVNSLNWL